MPHSVDMPDGVYSEQIVHAFESVGGSGGFNAASADGQVLQWYANVLPPSLEGTQVIDWGAGLGRFVPFVLKKCPSSLLLIEPSETAFQFLQSTYSRSKASTAVNVLKGGLGNNIRHLLSDSSATIHLCNYVVLCFSTPESALTLFETQVSPGERAFLVSNVFFPPSVLEGVNLRAPQSQCRIDLGDFTDNENAVLPTRVFTNRIEANGRDLHDAVHSIHQYSNLLMRKGSGWTVQQATVMPPKGFTHVKHPGDDYRSYEFAVLGLDLIRTHDCR